MTFLIEKVENGYLMTMAAASRVPQARYIFLDLDSLFDAVRKAVAEYKTIKAEAEHVGAFDEFP